MQEERTKQTQANTTETPSVAQRDEAIARITAELRTECDATPLAPEAEVAQAPKASVLQKEISSAKPDKKKAMAQAVAQNVLHSDEGVRPFDQGDDKFRDFFTKTAVVLPKDMAAGRAKDSAQEEQEETQEGKKSIFAKLARFFVPSAQQEADEDEDEDIDVFFPEEIAVQQVFPKAEAVAAQEASDETTQFDIFAMSSTDEKMSLAEEPIVEKDFVASDAKQSTSKHSPQKPKGKVRFFSPEEEAKQVTTSVATPKEAVESAPVAAEPEESPPMQVVLESSEKMLLEPVLGKAVAEEAEPAVPQESQAELLAKEQLLESLVQEVKREKEPKAAETIAPVQSALVEVEESIEEVVEEERKLASVAAQATPKVEKAQQGVAETAVEEMPITVEAVPEPVIEVEHIAMEVTPEDSHEVQDVQETQQVQTCNMDGFFGVGFFDAEMEQTKSTAQVSTEKTATSFTVSLEETEFLKEECQMQTAAKENVFTQFVARVQGAKERYFARREEKQLAVTQVEEERSENPEEINFFADDALVTNEPIADDFAVQPVANLETQMDISLEMSTEEESVVSEEKETAFFAPQTVEAASEQVLDEVALVEEKHAEERAEILVQEPVAQATVSVAPVSERPTPTKPSDYCLFDEAEDEAAAFAQQGEIVFVPALGAEAAKPHVPEGAAASIAVPTSATVVFDIMQTEGDFPEEEEDAPGETLRAAGSTEQMSTEEASADSGSKLEDLFQAEKTEKAGQPFEESVAKDVQKEALPEDPEGIQFGLQGMCTKRLMRTCVTGVFAVALFLLGLMGQGSIAPIAAIDPAIAPVPFLLIHLLLLLATAAVSYPVFIDGITGLWKTPSPDSLAAIAGLGAAVQLLLCLMLVDSFDASAVTLFSSMAGVVLFADAFGSFVMARVTYANFQISMAAIPHHLAYRVTAKDPVRVLSRGVEVDEPDLVVSRPVQRISGFLEKSFASRESDQRAQWISYGLLGGAVLAYLIALIKGQGAIGGISSFAAVLCIGAPLSLTLLAALPSLFMHRAAATVGAVVPGWHDVEALGDTNLLAVEAKDLFPPQCAQLHGIKTFQKERVDLAILYATSILLESCDTLHDLFAGMVGYDQSMLYPVKDLEVRHGLGFIGWCENYRVILGTRALMSAEGIALPALDYEERYSKNGRRQVLYLSVSGQLYAMFLVGYRGEKGVARTLRSLRKAHVRLLVKCTDPTLTAQRMADVYHMPAGFITLLSKEQTTTLSTLTDYRPKADGCMLHLGTFSSFAGGLKAAAGAASAERSASAIQLISAAFSLLLTLFLCITGGLMQVALVAILLYQVAWTVLTLGIVITKKFE